MAGMNELTGFVTAGSLCCDTAEEAKTLIPSLADKRSDEDLQELLEEVCEFKVWCCYLEVANLDHRLQGCVNLYRRCNSSSCYSFDIFHFSFSDYIAKHRDPLHSCTRCRIGIVMTR